MVLTKTDKKEIVGLMTEAITELVLPQLDDIQKEMGEIKEDLEDVKLTVNRIETRQKSEVERVDDHEIRITKIEKAIVV